jgi:hypothetical protein
MGKQQPAPKRFTDHPITLDDGYAVDDTPKPGENWLDAFNRGTREQVKQWIDAAKPKPGEP